MVPTYVNVESFPIAAVSKNRCWWCWSGATGGLNLKACSQCKVAKYCGVGCQKEHWGKGSHKLTCEAFKVARMIPDSGKIAFLAMVRCALEGGRFAEALFGEEGKFGSLVSHWEKLSEEKRKECVMVGSGVLRMWTRFLENCRGLSDRELWNPGLDVNAVFKLVSKVLLNGFTIVDCYQDECGVGLYGVDQKGNQDITLSKLNHSCDPSCVVIFPGMLPENMPKNPSKLDSISLGHGPLAKLRVIKDVCEGEELTITYIDLASTFLERQSFLKLNYFFECKCDTCTSFISSSGTSERGRNHFRCTSRKSSQCDGILVDESGHAVSIDRRTIDSTKMISSSRNLTCDKCKHPVSLENLENMISFLRGFLNNPSKFLDNFDNGLHILNSMLHQNNALRYTFFSDVSLIALNSQQWKIVSRITEFMLKSAPTFYNPRSLNIGILWLKYSRLLSLIGNNGEDAKYKRAIENAFKILAHIYKGENVNWH